MTNSEMFHPYEKLIEIEVLGKRRMVPENNSLLRAFQFLAMESISYGDFCWNGSCVNCQVWLGNGGKEKPVMACRTNVEAGMAVVKLTDTIQL